MSAPDLSVEVLQNEYLPRGDREVNAIVTIASSGASGAATGGSADDGAAGSLVAASGGTDRGGAAGGSGAEIIIVDCSGSMSSPMTKMIAARQATAAAIDAIRDGVDFAVIAGTNQALPAFPPNGWLATATATTRADAKRALSGLQPNGGTAIGEWLRLAHRMFQTSPATLRHAILLTDGKNEHESADQLAAAIRLCEGSFSCDCRGVGTDWVVTNCARSPPRCSAASTSCRIRGVWPPTSTP